MYHKVILTLVEFEDKDYLTKYNFSGWLHTDAPLPEALKPEGIKSVRKRTFYTKHLNLDKLYIPRSIIASMRNTKNGMLYLSVGF